MKTHHFQYTAMALAVGAVCCLGSAQAAEPSTSRPLEFNPSMLMGNAKSQDLSRFGLGNPVVPGVYRYDIFVNDEWKRRLDVEIVAEKDVFKARACASKELLSLIPVNVEKLSEEKQKLFQKYATTTTQSRDDCRSVVDIIEGATSVVQQGDLKLNITVPQALLLRVASGSVPRESWEDGVTAATLNYGLQRYQSQIGDTVTNNTFGSIELGASLGPLRYRHSATASSVPDQSTLYSVSSNYVYTDIPSLNGKLLFGTTGTSGQTFPNVRIKGLQFNSDDRMLPSSMRGYAPVIRGVAKTSGRVVISQRGVTVYQTPVSPGPFEITDLFSGGYGGELLVTVIEADGTQSSFTVNYSATPQLLREGAVSYQLAAGEYDETGAASKYSLFQGSAAYGVNSDVSLNTGLVASTRYRAMGLGAAFGSSIGSFSFDFLNSTAEVKEGQPVSGHSVRLGYATVIPLTQTNFTVANYQNSSEGYLSLDRALSLIAGNTIAGSGFGEKEQLVVSMNQSFGEFGSFYGSASRSSYWQSDSVETQFQLGWSKSFGRSFLSLSAVRQNVLGHASNSLSLSFVSQIGGPDRPVLVNGGLQGTDGGTSVGNVGLSGYLNEQRTARYGVNVGGSQGGQPSVGASTSLSTRYGSATANFSSGSGVVNRSLGFRGAVTAHAGGLIASPPTGDTITIVHAPGAEGAEILGGSGARINSAGYGIYAFASPYILNNVELDLKGLPLDVNMSSTSQRTVPKAGAATYLKFNSELSKYVVIEIGNLKSANLGFGTEIVDEAGNVVGYVGQGNKIQVHLKDENTKLFARSSKSPKGLLAIVFELPKKPGGALSVVKGTAVPADAAVTRGLEPQKMPQGADGELGRSKETRTVQQVDSSRYTGDPIQLAANAGSDRLELKIDTLMAAPEAKAAVRNLWKRITGVIKLPDGTVVPEGASLQPWNQTTGSTSSIGRDGRFVIRVDNTVSELLVEWGTKPAESCKVDITQNQNGDSSFICVNISKALVAALQ